MSEKNFKEYHIHLVSDATGETLETMAKAVLVQFEESHISKHFWPMIRSAKQMQRIMQDIKESPGLVMYTLVNTDIRETLLVECNNLGLPTISILDPVIDALAKFLGQKSLGLPGQQYVMNAEYFDRIEALQYTMAHDDGQMPTELSAAEIILVGVSRTSKTPTSIYIANRGIRTANIPFVQGCPMPDELDRLENAIVVGLTVSPDRLVQIRTNRLRSINEHPDTDYVDLERVKEEVIACRRYCSERDWPVIDVTRRSIEETAAAVMSLFYRDVEEHPERHDQPK